MLICKEHWYFENTLQLKVHTKQNDNWVSHKFGYYYYYYLLKLLLLLLCRGRRLLIILNSSQFRIQI